jgi:hypothetical protein
MESKRAVVLKKKLIDKINEIGDNDEALLERIENGLFKAVYGSDSATQIREFLNCNLKCKIEKGTANQGCFTYLGR